MVPFIKIQSFEPIDLSIISSGKIRCGLAVVAALLLLFNEAAAAISDADGAEPGGAVGVDDDAMVSQSGVVEVDSGVVSNVNGAAVWSLVFVSRCRIFERLDLSTAGLLIPGTHDKATQTQQSHAPTGPKLRDKE